MIATAQLPFARELQAFWHWWTAELSAVLSNRLHKAPRSAADVHLGRNGILIERTAEGETERYAEERPFEELDEEGWQDLSALIGVRRTRVILTEPDVHFASITVPAAARGRLRSAVAIKLNQDAPVEPGRLCWSLRPLREDSRSVTVTVAMAHQARIDQIQDGFSDHGLAGPAIVARGAEAEIELARGRASAAERSRRLLWGMAALLAASVPVTTWLGALVMTVSAENQVRALQAELAPKMAAERAAARDEQVRRALKMVLELPSATAAIEGLALGLPESAFAVSAERQFNGTLSIETQTTDRAALETAISETPLLAGLSRTMETAADEGRMQLVYRGMQR